MIYNYYGDYFDWTNKTMKVKNSQITETTHYMYIENFSKGHIISEWI